MLKNVCENTYVFCKLWQNILSKTKVACFVEQPLLKVYRRTSKTWVEFVDLVARKTLRECKKMRAAMSNRKVQLGARCVQKN